MKIVYYDKLGVQKIAEGKVDDAAQIIWDEAVDGPIPEECVVGEIDVVVDGKNKTIVSSDDVKVHQLGLAVDHKIRNGIDLSLSEVNDFLRFIKLPK